MTKPSISKSKSIWIMIHFIGSEDSCEDLKDIRIRGQTHDSEAGRFVSRDLARSSCFNGELPQDEHREGQPTRAGSIIPEKGNRPVYYWPF